MTIRDFRCYDEQTTANSRSVLLELWTMLGAYREHMVLVGGWVPYFLLELLGGTGVAEQHVGSIDVDIALDHRAIDESQYASIRRILERRGYFQKNDKLGNSIPFSFVREVKTLDEACSIEVDFLSAVAGGTGPTHRMQRVQLDLLARKARGCDVVFDHFIEYRLEGTLPDGSLNRVGLKVADLVGCLTTKGIAMGERYKEKDAYDVYMVIKHCLGGPAGVAERVAPDIGNDLVREGLLSLAEKFRSPDSAGSRWAAQFLTDDEEQSKQVALDAHMNVWEFLRLLDRQAPRGYEILEISG